MRHVSFILIRAFVRPAVIALCSVTSLVVLLLTIQVLSRVAFVPDLGGVLVSGLGFVPAAIVVALPVAVLAGTVSAGRNWSLGGEWVGLRLSGRSPLTVLPVVLVFGLAAGLVQATMLHYFEPAGRRQVRSALLTAAAKGGLRSGEPLVVTDGVLRAREVLGSRWRGVFLAQGDVVLTARTGEMRSGNISLSDGAAVDLDSGATMTFAQARLPLQVSNSRFEMVHRGYRSLCDLIARRERAGKSSSYERLLLYKRTTGALALPLLSLLGLPLGALRARPSVAALGVMLGWWLLTRLLDQLVVSLGALCTALGPLFVLTALCLGSWRVWSRR